MASAKVLQGIPVADAMKEDLQSRIAALKNRGTDPGLALLRVGDRPDDLFYEQAIQKTCASLGISLKIFPFTPEISQQELEKKVLFISADKQVHGILFLAPLPARFDEKAVRSLIPAQKDVDGCNQVSAGKVFTDDTTGFPPCTPVACLEMLKFYNLPLTGKNAVIMGRSLVVGKPLAMLLLRENATVTICHSKTENLPQICREADLLVAAIGRPRAVGADYIKPGQIILDVGVNPDPDNPGRYCGDVDFDSAAKIAAAITPAPGGVGSVTTAVLAKHTITAAERLFPIKK